MTILLVDDERMVRDLLSYTLAAGGYHTLEAASGAEAVRVARSFPGDIHLAIIDQTLQNGKSGVGVAAEIATIRPGMRLLLISGYPEEIALAGLPDDLTWSFLEKPFTPHVLLERIRRMLASVKTASS